MRSLFRKELRAARPFLALVLFFGSLNWLFMLLAEYPDQYPLSKLMSEESRSSSQILTFIVAWALAAGLLVRERDEGTLMFLDALPVSRAQIFICKFVVALGVLWLLPLTELLFNITFHALSRTSIETGFHWNILLTPALLDGAACVIYLSLGLAMSFLRRFALLMLGLLVWVLVLLKEWEVPYVPLLDIFSWSDPVFAGQRWLVPWAKLGVQLVLAVVCAGIAFVSFQFTGDAAQRLGAKAQGWRAGVLLGGLALAAIIALWLGLAVWFASKSDLSNKPRVRYADWATSRVQTERYQFFYPENRSDAVRPLLERADAVEGKVREFLRATSPGRIVVDMTDALPRHAGVAHWKKVQMSLPYDSAHADVSALAAVLGHETTHVYIDHLSRSRLNHQFNSTRFFHEGLASYVEYRLFLPTAKLASSRRVAAVMRARGDVKFEELVDDEALSLKRDGDLVYALGEVFVAALVKRRGDAAPGELLRAFARDSAPKNLERLALWQDTFQAAGYNLSDVTDEFFAELDRAVAEHRTFVNSVPRLQGAVRQSADNIMVRGSHKGNAPGTMVCRFRSRGDTDSRFYEKPDPDSAGTFQVDRNRYAERSFWYQLGWEIDEVSQPLYEPWVEVRAGR